MKKKKIIIIIAILLVFCICGAVVYSHEWITEKEVEDELKNNGILPVSVQIKDNSNADEVNQSLKESSIDAESVMISGKIMTIVITGDGEDKCSLNDHIMLARLYDIIYYGDYDKYVDSVKIRVVNSNGKDVYEYDIFGLGDFGKFEKNITFDTDAATKELTDTLKDTFKNYGLQFEETAINETEYGNRVYIRIQCPVNIAKTVNEEVESVVCMAFKDETSVSGITIELCHEKGYVISHMISNFNSGVTLCWMIPEVAALYGPPSL